MPPPKEKISLAIIGAGIASLPLVHALLQNNPNLSVKIYESRPQAGTTDGSGVGIGANGQKALALLSPDLPRALERAGAVENVPAVRIMLGQGREAGEVVGEVYTEPPQRTVLRARLLTELLGLLPEGTVETGRKVVDMTEMPGSDSRGKMRLTFEGGEEVVVDAVVGADGVNSFVRKRILPPPTSTGEGEGRWGKRFNTRIVIPMATAISIFGEEYCAHRFQIGWVGDGGFCLTDMEDDGDVMQVIAGFEVKDPGPEVYGKPYAVVDSTFWTEELRRGWGDIGEKISRAIETQEKPFASHGRLQDVEVVYAKGRMCLAGDSCGAFPPALGAGAGQAIEDALVLSAVLGCVTEAADLEKAFEVYGRIRKPRRKWVADMSTVQLANITGTREGVGLDKEKLGRAIQEPYEQLNGYDLQGAVAEAKRMMKE